MLEDLYHVFLYHIKHLTCRPELGLLLPQQNITYIFLLL